MKKTKKWDEKKTQFDVSEFNVMGKQLEYQRFPQEAEEFLKNLAGDSARYGWPYVVVRAYSWGVIMGKRLERSKKNKAQNAK